MHRFALYAALAAFIVIMVIYRYWLTRMVEAYGLAFAALAIIVCYALARVIHRRESGY